MTKTGQTLIGLSFLLATVGTNGYGVASELEPTVKILVETIEGQSTSLSATLLKTLPLSGYHPKAAALAKDALKDDPGITMREVSNIELISGDKVIKYARQLHGIDILNDWATVLVSKTNRIQNIRYSLTQPKTKSFEAAGIARLSQFAKLWRLNEQKALAKFRAHSQLWLESSSVKKSWYKIADSLVPAYTVTAREMVVDMPAIFKLVLSADNAQVLASYPLSYDLTAYTYRVYADKLATLPFQNPHGNTSPHLTGSPIATLPSEFVPQEEFLITELSDSRDDPWLGDDAIETIGNNADVFFNFTRGTDGVFDFFGDGYGPEYRVRGDGFDEDFRAPIDNNTLSFNYQAEDYSLDYNQPFDSSTDPSVEQIEAINAKQVQAFYMANLMHDIFYDAGFTEAAGNAQSSNFGRGGIENDPLIVHINSFTFVSSPEDGTSPVIHLGRSRGGDTSFDTSIFAHEWTHYMYQRLVNPGLLLSDNQADSLNEGWADVVGLLMSAKPADLLGISSIGFTSSYAIGSYFAQDRVSDTFPAPYFYGIRRYPYGVNNPFSFRHIAHKAELPLNYQFSDYVSRGTQNSQTHTAGEIWANTVWNCFQGIVKDKLVANFDTKRDLLASYIVGGMSLLPVNPSFLEARNALLAAIKQNSLVDYAVCRNSFAQKGMGSAAQAPPKSSKTFSELVESFENHDLHLSIVQSNLKDNLSSLDEDGILDQSETGQLSLTVKNTGFETIDLAVLSLGQSLNDYTVVSTATVQIANVLPGQERQVRFSLRLNHDRKFDLTDLSIDVALNGANPNWARNYQLQQSHRTHYDLATQLSSNSVGDQFDTIMRDWTLNRLQVQSFVDSKWQEVVVDSNSVFEIQEPNLGGERDVNRAWESPWMTRSVGSLAVTFMHSHEFSNGFAVVEITDDGVDWLPFTGVDDPYVGVSAGFPSLIQQTLINGGVLEGAQFKIRFRITARGPLTWRFDDISIAGVSTQPFQEILEEDGKDIVSFCVPIKASSGIAVICL